MELLNKNDLFLDYIDRMKHPQAVQESMNDPANANPDPMYPDFPSWNDLALADGYPSILLFFAELQRLGMVDENHENIAHQYVLKIKEALEKKGCEHFSLFGGISGICFALQQASCNGKRYQRMLDGLHNYLFQNIERVYLEPFRHNLNHHKPIFAFFYDPIQGICGIGRYLLEMLSFPHFFEVTQEIVQLLVRFTHPITIDGKSIPGWYSSPEDPLNSNHGSNHPRGNFNLGLAHGVTGALAFLAIALLRGVEVKGQREAIQNIASWLCEKSFLEQNTIQWPSLITWEEEVEKMPPMKLPCKDAWCYGSPGIARSLFLAGNALQNEQLKSFAAKAFRDVFFRPQSDWGLPGPMLCHGIAGLLLISRSMAKEKECQDLIPKVKELEKTLLSFYTPDALYGFQDVEPCKNGMTAQINKVGLLSGATGVFLTLLTADNSQSKWHLPFLIDA